MISKITQPTIKIDGVHSRLIHKPEEVNPTEVKIGMKVEAVFKPKQKREGSINDIKHFKAIK